MVVYALEGFERKHPARVIPPVLPVAVAGARVQIHSQRGVSAVVFEKRVASMEAVDSRHEHRARGVVGQDPAVELRYDFRDRDLASGLYRECNQSAGRNGVYVLAIHVFGRKGKRFIRITALHTDHGRRGHRVQPLQERFLCTREDGFPIFKVTTGHAPELHSVVVVKEVLEGLREIVLGDGRVIGGDGLVTRGDA